MTRVMVVLPFYGGSLPVGRYCVDALRDNGCLVDVFESPAFFGAYEAFRGLNVRQDRLDYLENSFMNVIGDSILAQVERFQPDLVLAMAQAPLSRKVLKRLRHDGVATAMWFVEDYRLFVYWRAFAPLYDYFAVIQREPFLDELRAIGVENSLYLPMAALPTLHRPLAVADNKSNSTASATASVQTSSCQTELNKTGLLQPGSAQTELTDKLNDEDRRLFGASISFMGAGYPNRRVAFRSLTNYDFKFWGTEWEGESQLTPHWQMPGVRISSEQAVKIFNAAEINLNLHSSVKPEETVSFGDFVNPRTFEIAACGAFQLVDERGLLPELFGPDELATFNSLEDLKAKIDYFLKHPEERADFAARGRERVLRDHTYQNRMKTLLDFIAEKRPGWPPSRNQSPWPEGMPEELTAQLDALMQDLQLPPKTDFDSLLTALRSRSGTLSGLESALLFLDEWRKQYIKA